MLLKLVRMNYLKLLILSLLFIGCTEKNTNKVTVNSKQVSQQLPSVPQSMELFGETIHLTDEDIRERLDHELTVNAFFQSSTTLIIKRANRYFPILEQLLKEENLHDDFKYLCVIESNLTQAKSPAGAQGFWQFMPETAKEYKLLVTNEVDERLDVEKSTRAACAYLRKAYAELDNWILAAAAYNRGLGGVQSDLKSQYVSTYFDTEMNNETSRYVFRIMALKLILENPKSYGFNLQNKDLYPTRKIRKVNVHDPILDLALWAKNNQVTLKIVRKLNPWLLKNTLTTPPINYIITLPHSSYNLKQYSDYRK